jgi:hypothetical protein
LNGDGRLGQSDEEHGSLRQRDGEVLGRVSLSMIENNINIPINIGIDVISCTRLSANASTTAEVRA